MTSDKTVCVVVSLKHEFYLNFYRLWLRPGQEVVVKVTLMDAIGRELLDEHGPRVTWEVEPYHAGIEFKAADRLFVETDPEYAPVPVPHKYYQVQHLVDKCFFTYYHKECCYYNLISLPPSTNPVMSY